MHSQRLRQLVLGLSQIHYLIVLPALLQEPLEEQELEPLLEQLTTWGDQDSLVRNLAGLGARALAEADREAEADAFWEKWTQS